MKWRQTGVADTIVGRGNDNSTAFFGAAPAVQKQTQEEDIQEKASGEEIIQRKGAARRQGPGKFGQEAFPPRMYKDRKRKFRKKKTMMYS